VVPWSPRHVYARRLSAIREPSRQPVMQVDSLGGLSAAEAQQRLARDGPNALPVQRPPAASRLLLAQMGHFFALLLWAAGGLAFIAGMPQLDVAIFIIILVNGIFAYVREHRAERAAERLRDLMPKRATVMRDGIPWQIPAESWSLATWCYLSRVIGSAPICSCSDRTACQSLPLVPQRVWRVWHE
jgi:magnesium-transporting ATPase (P-type)